MSVKKLYVLALSATLFGPTVTAAARADESARFLADLMGRTPGPGKTFACFARVYDEAHLTAHPGQNVRALHTLVTAYLTNGERFYQLRIGLQLRGRPETFTTTGECGEGSVPDTVRSGAVCAGPGGPLRLALEGKDPVLMTLSGAAEFWRPSPPDPNNTLKDALGPDDTVFRLDRSRLSDCDDQFFDDERKALIDRGQ